MLIYLIYIIHVNTYLDAEVGAEHGPRVCPWFECIGEGLLGLTAVDAHHTEALGRRAHLHKKRKGGEGKGGVRGCRYMIVGVEVYSGGLCEAVGQKSSRITYIHLYK